MTDLYGMPIIESPFVGVRRYQWKFPRSHKKRIRKKFAKDPRNWREEKTSELFMIDMAALGGAIVGWPGIPQRSKMIVASPRAAAALRNLAR